MELVFCPHLERVNHSKTTAPETRRGYERSGEKSGENIDFQKKSVRDVKKTYHVV
jgi:hypothetical protein